MYHKMKENNILIKMLKLLLIFYHIGYTLGKAEPQDNQNFFYNSQQTQGQFVPTYQNARSGFLQGGTPAIDSRRLRNNQPDSYQEQTLFIEPGSNRGASNVQDTTPNYFSSFPSYTTTRHSDVFEISPRPFSIQPHPNSGFSFSRQSNQPSRQTDGNGQRAQKQNSHEYSRPIQNPRLPAINPITEKATTYIGQRAGPSSSYTPSSTFNRNKNNAFKFSNDYYSNEDYRNTNSNKNTFRNNRFRTNPSIATSTEEITTSSSTRRKNRFSPSARPATRSTKTSAPPTKSSIFHTRRPSTNFNSGEIYSNEFPSRFSGNNNIFNKPLTSINITHNGGSKLKDNSYEDNVDEVLLDENYDYIIDKKNRGSYQKIDATSSTTTAKPVVTAIPNPKIPDYYNSEDYLDYSSITTTTVPELPEEERTEVKEEEKITEKNKIKEEENEEENEGELEEEHEEEKKQEEKKEEKIELPAKEDTTAVSINETIVETKPDGDGVKLDENTVILTDNFYLPKNQHSSGSSESSQEDESSTGSSGEYEYYEDYSEEDTENPVTAETITDQNKKHPDIAIESNEDDTIGNKSPLPGDQVISVVTTKSVVNGSVMDYDDQEQLAQLIKPFRNGSDEDSNNGTTESWVVVASVQTSRSVSGARFLPFPSVNQDEKKQTLTDLETHDSNEGGEDFSNEAITTDNNEEQSEEITTASHSNEALSSTTHISSTTTKLLASQSTESIIDKLDRVQSELSSGLLSGKFPILHDMGEHIETTTKSSLPLFRKFANPRFNPQTYATSSTTHKPIEIESLPMDDISSLLPPGFKPRPPSSYKNRKITTTTSTTTTPNSSNQEQSDLAKPIRNSTNTRSFKNNIAAQDVNISGLLPKGYKPPSNATEGESAPKLGDLLKKIKFEESLDKLIPSDYKPNKKPDTVNDDIPGFKSQNTATKRPLVNVSDDINKFLPPGFQPLSTTKRPQGIVTISEDVSKFLPPGFRLNSYSTRKPQTTSSYKKVVPAGYEPSTPAPQKENKPSLPSLPIIPISDNLSKFLPPGYKLDNKEKPIQKPTVIALNEDLSISKLLPPGYKEKAEKADTKKETDNEASSILSKIQFKEVADLLPPGFKLNVTTETEPTQSTTTTKSKVIFPNRPGFSNISNKKPGQRIATTPSPSHHGDAPSHHDGTPEVVIKKGPPVRATTEFTGWPTPSTTPFSIEKLLEQQRAQAFDIANLLPSSSSPKPTTTTTTTTTTPRPTTPGLCRSECNLAGTIKIVDGVTWKPELLDHNTVEWKNLAKEVEIQLNEVYTNAKNLRKWYKGVTIDSFSKGSVLVDYWIELNNLSHDVDTLEIKRLFHDALVPSPIEDVTVNASRLIENGTDAEFYTISEPQQNSRNNLILGKFVVDPISTDFIVLPKQIQPTVGYADHDVVPQWAVAVIVIGLGSLLFVILFGVTVIVNRQKRSKKKAPTPLTADMLNELNKNHMGGVENYGREDLYNVDDAWDRSSRRNEIKPKRFTNSMHGSSQSNIYDSWRSQRHQPQPDYYYESHNNYFSNKNGPYPPDDYPESHHNSMSMYTYNPRRVNRTDYDADF